MCSPVAIACLPVPSNGSLDDVSSSVPAGNRILILLCWAHLLGPLLLGPLLLSPQPRVRHAVCRAKKSGSKPAAPAITFADVAGVENAKEELREVGVCQRTIQILVTLPQGGV